MPPITGMGISTSHIACQEEENGGDTTRATLELATFGVTSRAERVRYGTIASPPPTAKNTCQKY